MRLLLVALILLLAARAAVADERASCTAASVGTVACIAGVLCSCGPGRGDAGLGPAAGLRWDCGILRPHCGPAADPPATLAPWPYGLPPGLSLEVPHPILHSRDRPRYRPHDNRGSEGYPGSMENGP